VPDLRSPEAQDAHLHVGLAEFPLFHVFYINNLGGDSQAIGAGELL
jgi:hypothetical protein